MRRSWGRCDQEDGRGCGLVYDSWDVPEQVEDGGDNGDMIRRQT